MQGQDTFFHDAKYFGMNHVMQQKKSAEATIQSLMHTEIH